MAARSGEATALKKRKARQQRKTKQEAGKCTYHGVCFSIFVFLFCSEEIMRIAQVTVEGKDAIVRDISGAMTITTAGKQTYLASRDQVPSRSVVSLYAMHTH